MDRIKYLAVAILLSLFVSGCSSVKPDVGQDVFVSPEEATTALRDAVRKNDDKRVMEIFGPQGKDIVYSGDEKLDSEARAFFTKRADEKVELTKIEDECFLLQLGNDKWTFPVPLAKYDGKWFFNTPEGLEELLNRRIGRNEIYVIKVCGSIVSAQEEYATLKSKLNGASEYAMKFFSDSGKLDGLYWDAEVEKKVSPVGARLVLASLEIDAAKRKPYYGYYYKMLTAQGPDAPGGKKSYLVDGKMKNGFALLAYPANYGVAGIKSFIVSKSGVVFEKDLGKDTARLAPATAEFNPDDSWAPVRD